MLTTQSFLFTPAPFSTGSQLVQDPLGPLAPEEIHMVPSSDGEKEYKILRRKNYYQCSCPAFKYQFDTFWEHRTCKHIIAFRGQEAEDARIKAAKIVRYGPTGERPDISSLPLAPHTGLVLGPLAPEETHEVVGTKGDIYTIMRRKDYYQCTCPSFRFQKGIFWECRTCKHIKELRGEQSEICRTVAAKIRRATARRLADAAARNAARKLRSNGSVKRVLVKKKNDKGKVGAVRVKIEPIDETPTPTKSKVAKRPKDSSMKKVAVKKEPKESTVKKAMKKMAVKKEPKESTVKKAMKKIAVKEPKESTVKKAMKKIAVKKEPKESTVKKAMKKSAVKKKLKESTVNKAMKKMAVKKEPKKNRQR